MGGNHCVDGRQDTRAATHFEPCPVGPQNAGDLCLSCQKVHIDQMVPQFVDIDGAPIGFGIGLEQHNYFGHCGEGGLAGFQGRRTRDPWMNAFVAA